MCAHVGGTMEENEGQIVEVDVPKFEPDRLVHNSLTVTAFSFPLRLFLLRLDAPIAAI